MSFSPLILLLLNSKDYLLNKAWMVVIITMGASDFSCAGFRFLSVSLYQESRENELILSYLYISFFLPLILILAFIKEQMVSYVFFSFFLEEKAGGSSEKTPDNFGVSR